jgi:gliding motility-associated-like protein
VNDGKGGTNTVTVNVTVTPVNHSPVVDDPTNPAFDPATKDYNIITPENTQIGGTVKATDIDGDYLTITKRNNPSHGTVVLNSNGTYTYTPDPGYTGNDSFTVIFDDGKSGITSTTINVIVTPQTQLKFYNGLSPNGDGNNDVWWIDGIENYADNEVYIFNRWGDKIIELRNYDNVNVVWDGRNNHGKKLPDGTYYYLVKIKNDKSYTGWIQIRTGNN